MTDQVADSENQQQQTLARFSRAQLDAHGTPMPVKSPMTFKQVAEKQQEKTKAARRKLMIVTIVSCFFITA